MILHAGLFPIPYSFSPSQSHKRGTIVYNFFSIQTLVRRGIRLHSRELKTYFYGSKHECKKGKLLC